MEIVIGILGLVIALASVLIPFLRKRYIARPEVTIEMIKNSASSFSRGLSKKNKMNEEGDIDGSTAIRTFELTWRFKIRITNNSELTAFYPELDFNPNGPEFTLIDNLNKLQPIKPTETIELSVEYRKYEEKTGQERTDVVKEMPTELTNLNLLLTYQNSHRTNFYTLFSFSEKKNLFLRKKPREYRKN